MSALIEDFKTMRERNGFIGLKNKYDVVFTPQNVALFTVEYVVCMMNDPDTTEAEKKFELKRIYELFKLLEVRPGLSIRFPGSREFDSMDNNLALLVFSALYGNREYAIRMRNHGLTVKCQGVDPTQDAARSNKFFNLARLLNWGRKPQNYWNNNFPELFCFFGWYGRSPGFMGLIDIAATGNTSLFRKVSLLVGQFVGAFNKRSDTDARKLPYVVWHLLKDRGLVWRLAYKLWLKLLRRVYPEGMKEVYSVYFRPTHPIVKHTRD
jgi:hypothetical protein